MSYELLLKERDELQREAATANAELFAVLKQSEYRSAEELGLVRAQAPHQEHSPPCSSLPTLAQPAIHHVCRAPFTSRCARCQTNAFRHPPVFMNWDACPQSARRRCCCCTVALVGDVVHPRGSATETCTPRPPDLCSNLKEYVTSFLPWQDCMARMALEAQQAPIPDFPADSNALHPQHPQPLSLPSDPPSTSCTLRPCLV